VLDARLLRGQLLERVTIVLDGAMGTALAGRDSPERVIAIHRDAVHAGAQIVTTHSFVIDTDSLERADLAVGWAQAGIDAARGARADAGRVKIAGSIGALGRRSADASPRAYGRLARALVDSGAEIVFVETLIDADDARAAVEGIAGEVAAPLWISVACGPDGHILGRGALPELLIEGVDALVVGCTEHVGLDAALARLPRGACWRGVQPSTGLTIDGRFTPDGADEPTVARTAVDLARSRSLELVGGCCGTSARYVRAVADQLHPRPEDRAAAFDALDAHVREAAG